jgi:ATP-dependent DNA helicase RecQ
MGVDKVDVRLVIHADLTRTIEAYYQEAGRGGRDGEHADCVLLFNHGDVRLQEFLIAASCPSAELLRGLWKLLREQPGLTLEGLAGFNLPGDPHESTVSSAVRILGRHGYLVDESGALHSVQPKEISGTYPEFDAHASERRAEVETAKLKHMVEYSYHAGCRHEFVLDYFGEERAEERPRCQACDNCQGFGEAETLSETQLEHAEMLLTIVGELDGRFGRRRIASIANGSDDDERFYGMANRGALSGTSQKAILDLLRSLEAGSLVQQTGSEYPTIRLSRTGKKIVRGQASIDPDLLRLLPSSGKATKRRNRSTANPALEGDADPEVADRLRTLRSDLAREHSVPAYVVFSNRTLDELAILKPQSRDELDGVHGIGPSRIDKYGDAIIALITTS